MSELLLLSGGIDSTCLAYARRPVACLTINYGQRAALGEIRASTAICQTLGLNHHMIDLPISDLGRGTMVGGTGVSHHTASEEWWPYRNQVLISIAASFAIKYEIDRIIIGTVATDNRHADGSRAFVKCMSKLLALQEGSLEFLAPAIRMTTEELVRKSLIPIEVLMYAHSCHAGSYACGVCGGCAKHSRVMASLGIDR